MTLPFDPEYAELTAPLAETLASFPKYPVGDVASRREAVLGMLVPMMNAIPDVPGVKETVHHTTTSDGHSLAIHEYNPNPDASNTAPGPAIFYMHGGGMILGGAAMFSKPVSERAAAVGHPIYSVDYRLAPEHPHPTPVEDCYTALLYLHSHATALHIDPSRIAITGESAGGGIAASLALLARDRNLSPPICKQVLVYPMLDDRTTVVDPSIGDKAFWTTDDNMTGWGALLGEKAGKSDADVSPYAAAARAKSLKGLPATYIDVGTLDIFRDEDLRYAMRLLQDGVQCEVHAYPGVPHAFESLAPGSELAKLATRLRTKVLRDI